MIGYSTVTQKGQVTIPADIRRMLKLTEGQRVVITADGDGVKLKTAPDFFSLYGSVNPKKRPEDFKKMRQEFIKYLSSRKRRDR